MKKEKKTIYCQTTSCVAAHNVISPGVKRSGGVLGWHPCISIVKHCSTFQSELSKQVSLNNSHKHTKETNGSIRFGVQRYQLHLATAPTITPHLRLLHIMSGPIGQDSPELHSRMFIFCTHPEVRKNHCATLLLPPPVTSPDLVILLSVARLTGGYLCVRMFANFAKRELFDSPATDKTTSRDTGRSHMVVGWPQYQLAHAVICDS